MAQIALSPRGRSLHVRVAARKSRPRLFFSLLFLGKVFPLEPVGLFVVLLLLLLLLLLSRFNQDTHLRHLSFFSYYFPSL
jgi:hypothetical protein